MSNLIDSRHNADHRLKEGHRIGAGKEGELREYLRYNFRPIFGKQLQRQLDLQLRNLLYLRHFSGLYSSMNELRTILVQDFHLGQ